MIEAVCALRCVGHNNRDAACYDQRLMFGQSQGLECVFPPRHLHRGFQTQSKESFSPMLIIPSRCTDRLSVLCLWRIREAVKNPARVSGCIDFATGCVSAHAKNAVFIFCQQGTDCNIKRIHAFFFFFFFLIFLNCFVLCWNGILKKSMGT